MRTRWDEVEEADDGSHRFLGFSAVTWSMAVPVAFIAGAAIMSFFAQPRPDTAPLAIPAPVAGEGQKVATESRVVADRGRWEEEARQAAAMTAELQMQVEAMRDQINDETRRREQAEQVATQTAAALKKAQEAEASRPARPATALAVSNPQAPLSYAEPTGAASAPFGAAQGAEANSQRPAGAGPNAGQQSSGASNDSIALQRIIEDTASRSAALSDRKDEMEAEAPSSPSGHRTSTSPRNASNVETALSQATGLETLSSSQRTGLKEELVAGACVTVSLEKVFGNPVPVVPLRNLVRDLDSDC